MDFEERMAQRTSSLGHGDGMTLGTVMKRYRAGGHRFAKFNCDCCFSCTRCGLALIDDLRADYPLDEPCKPALPAGGK
jgi:hypothetical protein